MRDMNFQKYPQKMRDPTGFMVEASLKGKVLVCKPISLSHVAAAIKGRRKNRSFFIRCQFDILTYHCITNRIITKFETT